MIRPTPEEYTQCAELAHEFNELVAIAELAGLLERESDHALLCRVGIWYWQCGHNTLAAACYRRSLDLHPVAATDFNLAVCLDDEAGEPLNRGAVADEGYESLVGESVDALRAAIGLYDSAEARRIAEDSLRANGKEHLLKRLGRNS